MKKQLIDKHPQHCDLIDSEARNLFSQGLRASALKCTFGFNMHGEIDCAINRNVMDSSCPRCSELACWDHFVKCRCVEGKRDECLSKLKTKFMKVDDENVDLIKNKMVSDMIFFIKMMHLLKLIRKY